jgi:hypothetical protein
MIRRDSESQRLVHIYSFLDHPREWSSVPQFNFIEYSEPTRDHLRGVLSKNSLLKDIKPNLKIVSIHWGPNYSWSPSADIKSLTHYVLASEFHHHGEMEDVCGHDARLPCSWVCLPSMEGAFRFSSTHLRIARAASLLCNEPSSMPQRVQPLWSRLVVLLEELCG